MSNRLIRNPSDQGKANKKKSASQNSKIWIALGIIVIVALIAVIILAGTGGKDGEKSTADGIDGASTAEEVKGIQLPYNSGSEDENLEISALYQFSGPNPDCQNEDGEDIASLTVTNTTDRLMTSAQITVTLDDKTEYAFYAEYIPAGKTAQIYDIHNAVYTVKDEEDQKIPIEAIDVDAEFSDTMNLMQDQLEIEVKENETEVKLTNKSDQDLTDLVMRCHTLFDEEYFGGLTYTYQVGTIPAGDSLTVDAVDCYIGTAEVVELSQE